MHGAAEVCKPAKRVYIGHKQAQTKRRDCAKEQNGTAMASAVVVATVLLRARRALVWLQAMAFLALCPATAVSHPFPHLSRTHKPAPSIVAPSSSFLQCGAVRHLHIHGSPCGNGLSSPSSSSQFHTYFSPVFIRLSLVSPHLIPFLFSLFVFASRCP